MHSSTSNRSRAVLYSRLSRESLVSTSLQGQAEDLAALAEREGWTVIRAFVDEGLSGGRRRANADEAVRMLADGEADVLAAYSVDRFSRQGIGEDAELVRVVRIAPGRRRVLFVREGIDSASDPRGWPMRFAIASEMARGERDVMVSRRTASIARLRREGRSPGLGPAPFGYRSAPFDDGRPGRRLIPDPDEATLIREYAVELLEGRAASRIAAELNERGVPMPRSAARLARLRGEDAEGLETGTWSSSRVSQLWASEHLLGRIMARTAHTKRPDDWSAASAEERTRSRFGEPVLGPDGLPLQAFEPVLDLSTMLALRERFARNVGRGRSQVRRASRLLSGLLFDTSDEPSPLYVQTARKKRPDGSTAEHVYYRSSNKARGRTEADVSIRAETAETYVSGAYLHAVGHLQAVREVVRREDEFTERAAQITERMDALAASLMAGEGDDNALLDEVRRLRTERDALRAAEPARRIEYEDLGATWGELWRRADVDRRRRYLLDAIDHVLVFPASASDRLRIQWREGDPDETD